MPASSRKRWEWERIQARLFKVNIRSLALRQYQDSGAVLINQTKNIVITGLVASLVVQGEMTLGMMLSVQYIIGQLNSPINELITFARDMQDARLSTNRLGEVRDSPDEEDPTKDLIREIPTGKDLRIENLSFKYDPLGETPTLDNISLEIASGRQTAIVGMSGSGKTTLVKLLLGFYPPASGQILLGDTSLENFSIREWRKRCGVVMQDGFIFSDSIAGNIAPGVEHIDKGTPCGMRRKWQTYTDSSRDCHWIQHPDRPGRARIEPGTETAHTHRPRRVQEPGIHLLRRSHQRTGCQQRAHHHGEPAALLRRKDIGSGGPPAEYRAECRPDSGDRAGTDSGNGDARGTDSEGRKVL